MPSDQPNPTDTHDGVRTATASVAEPVALDTAVLQSQTGANPADPVQATLNEHDNRLTQIEAVLGTLSPVVIDALPGLAKLVPGAGPILTLLPTVITTLNALIGALASTAPGKIASALPDQIKPT